MICALSSPLAIIEASSPMVSWPLSNTPITFPRLSNVKLSPAGYAWWTLWVMNRTARPRSLAERT